MSMLTVSSSKLKETFPDLDPSDFTLTFPSPIDLGSFQYKVALYRLSTWFSSHNVVGKTIEYTIGMSPYTLNIPDGNYIIQDINTLLDNDVVANGGTSGDILISPNYNTNRVDITLQAGYTIDFSAPNNIASFLGFPEAVLSSSDTGSTIADVTGGVDSWQLRCNLITGSYDGSTQSDIIYTFIPAVPVNSALEIIPIHLSYFQINKTVIDSIRFKLTDQNGNTINLQGEDLIITLVIERL